MLYNSIIAQTAYDHVITGEWGRCGRCLMLKSQVAGHISCGGGGRAFSPRARRLPSGQTGFRWPVPSPFAGHRRSSAGPASLQISPFQLTLPDFGLKSPAWAIK